MKRRIFFLVLPEIQLLDLAGPADVFRVANQIAEARGVGTQYEVSFAGPDENPGTVTGIGLRVNGLPESIHNLDTLIVPGGMGFGETDFDSTALAWIRAHWRGIRRVVSICTGAFVLAQAGVLSGRSITTHWIELARLRSVVPDAKVETDALYVKDGPIYTSAGIAAGIDLALALVDEDLGSDITLEVARTLVMFLHRPGGQSQFSAALQQPKASHQKIRDVQAYVAEHPQKDHRVSELAERAAMSTRNFIRVFTRETGEPPARFVQRVRVERARQLLESSRLRIGQVAEQCGFGTAETMRRRFEDTLGVSPSEYRARFSKRGNHFRITTPPKTLKTLDTHQKP